MHYSYKYFKRVPAGQKLNVCFIDDDGMICTLYIAPKRELKYLAICQCFLCCWLKAGAQFGVHVNTS